MTLSKQSAVNGQLKVLGARADRSGYVTSRSPRHLQAFDATGNPLTAEWKYATDSQWKEASHWQDVSPHLMLHVRYGEDQLVLNPANICGNGTIGSNMGNGAFVALRDDGRVIGWGTPGFGGGGRSGGQGVV